MERSEGDGPVGPYRPVGEVVQRGPVGEGLELVVRDGAGVQVGGATADLGAPVAG